jgi:hypothetical protein
MEELQLQHAPEQWMIFINSSKFSLKEILLHNGNKQPSVSLIHAVHMKEAYANIQGLLGGGGGGINIYILGKPPVERTC